MDIKAIGKSAKAAAAILSSIDAEKRAAALKEAARNLRRNIVFLLSENEKDLKTAKEAGLSDALIDRLMLNEARINSMADSIESIANIPDLLNKTIEEFKGLSGIKIKKVSVPLGVIGIIYEARPNVTADAAAICLKAGSACVLRGGKEAINSNIAIAKIINDAYAKCGMPNGTLNLIEDTSRESATALMNLRELSVIIPRGGKGLIKSTVENSKVPVIETGSGNCHAYVDKGADLKMATDIVVNGKCQRPSVCNALETLLVHKDEAETFLPMVYSELKKYGCEIRGDDVTCRILKDAVPATEEDYKTEFLDYIIAVKVVNNIDEAINHIAKYSSNHSEVIITKNEENARRFQREVDSAAVYWNASTRFTDGGEFGFFAEIGISTQKIHARGPMGIAQLLSYKYVIDGQGEIR